MSLQVSFESFKIDRSSKLTGRSCRPQFQHVLTVQVSGILSRRKISNSFEAQVIYEWLFPLRDHCQLCFPKIYVMIFLRIWIYDYCKLIKGSSGSHFVCLSIRLSSTIFIFQPQIVHHDFIVTSWWLHDDFRRHSETKRAIRLRHTVGA